MYLIVFAVLCPDFVVMCGWAVLLDVDVAWGPRPDGLLWVTSGASEGCLDTENRVRAGSQRTLLELATCFLTSLTLCVTNVSTRFQKFWIRGCAWKASSSEGDSTWVGSGASEADGVCEDADKWPQLRQKVEAAKSRVKHDYCLHVLLLGPMPASRYLCVLDCAVAPGWSTGERISFLRERSIEVMVCYDMECSKGVCESHPQFYHLHIA